MAQIYDKNEREFVDAQYDAATNSYFTQDGRCLGSAESKYSHGSAIERKDVEYDPATDGLYRRRDDRRVADGGGD